MVNGCDIRNRPNASKLFLLSRFKLVRLLMNLTISSWLALNVLRYSLSWLLSWL